ncbi:MAG: ABC transporter permease [Bacteroidetes bacterium]|nr:ABC transporter permease [Bacteroidota bacterium]
MNKIAIIIKREYLTRVRKRSFVIMTILGPLLMAALMIGPVFIAKMSDSVYQVGVVDDSDFFFERLKNTNNVEFSQLNLDIEAAIELHKKGNYDAILHIPKFAFEAPSGLRMFSEKSVNLNAKLNIENQLKLDFESLKLAKEGIDEDVLQKIKTSINIMTVRLTKDGLEKTDYPELRMVLGIFSGILIYFFIFLFGSQVMRGVMEEKTNRIVEVIISSVKPFQLMMGKIIGVALVGLTQFLIWIFLTLIIVTAVQTAFPEQFKYTPVEQVYISADDAYNPEVLKERTEIVMQYNSPAGQIMDALSSINLPVMIGSFIFFFLAGYLLYASLFAAIGAAVDNEADTQQFMLPITVPLIFAIVMAQMVANNPSGPVAVWLSMIPFTSPIIMMLRIPFGVPMAQVYLSMALLVLGFVGTTWLASKIYRTGILMYGKKVSYKEIWKWIKFKG